MTVWARAIKIKNLDSGKILQVSGFLLDSCNYIRLRDTEKLAPLLINWDEAEKISTIRINYREE